MINIYDTANQLERELRQSKQYLALKKAMENVESDAKAKKQFAKFKKITEKFQEFQMSGQQPTEEDIKEAEEVATQAQKNTLILELVKAEQETSALINELNNIITKPLSELYNV